VYQERGSALLTGMNSPHPFGAWVERTQHHDTGATRSVRRPANPSKVVTDDAFAMRRSRGRSVIVPRQRRGD
jgi:hypothetical protein